MSEEGKDLVRKAIIAGNVDYSERAQIAIANFAWGPNAKPDDTLTDVGVIFWGPWYRDACKKCEPGPFHKGEATKEPSKETHCAKCGSLLEKFGNGGGIGIDWMTVSAGCGRVDFHIENGKLNVQSQAKSKDFARKLFDYIIENTEWDDHEHKWE